MAKSRANFSSRLKALQKKYEVVNEDYFENMVGLTIEIEDLEQKIFDYKQIIFKLGV